MGWAHVAGPLGRFVVSGIPWHLPTVGTDCGAGGGPSAVDSEGRRGARSGLKSGFGRFGRNWGPGAEGEKS